MADLAIHRHEVPIDDQWHFLPLTGDIVSVGARRDRVVEIWAVHTDEPVKPRAFRVFGTGQPLPEGALCWHGSVIVAGGALVFHLAEADR